MEIMDRAADIVEAGGIEAWSRATAEEILGAEDAAHYTKSSDIPGGLVRLRLDLLPRPARLASGGPPRNRPRGRPLTSKGTTSTAAGSTRRC